MIEYRVDEEKGIIYNRFSHDVNLTDAISHLKCTVEDPKCKISYGRIIEIEHGSMNVPLSQSNFMVQLWEKFAERQEQYICAIVCDRTSEQMIRVLMQESHLIDNSVRFFREASEAELWLEENMS